MASLWIVFIGSTGLVTIILKLDKLIVVMTVIILGLTVSFDAFICFNMLLHARGVATKMAYSQTYVSFL